jgi:D-amino peptidase
MKIFISCDMEGVAGIVDWSQCRAPGQPYEEGRRLLLGEVNAAIDGATEADATEIVCNDSHGTMFNLDPAALHGRAAYVAGRHKPMYMMQGLDASFDAVFLIGYHGSISGEGSVLSHTYNPQVISHVEVNGTRAGESGINALAALAYRVPIALVTGDQHTIAEAAPFCPGAESVTTKESLTRFGAVNLHPETARVQIRDAAMRAAERAKQLEPPAIDLPATLDVHLQTADMAQVAAWVRGVTRTGLRTIRIEGDDPLGMFQAFVAVTYITRVSEGRLGRRAGRGTGGLIGAPAGYRFVPVEPEAALPLGRLGSPVRRGYPPHHLELDTARVLGVQRFRHPVVALPHQRTGLNQAAAHRQQVRQRADFPGQVVEPDARLRGHARPDLEQAEVVVVLRAGSGQECGSPGDLGADLETQHRGIEGNLTLQAAHVQHGVVQASDGHQASSFL